MKPVTDINLTPTDLKMFESLGVPLELFAAARIERVTDQEARENSGSPGWATCLVSCSRISFRGMANVESLALCVVTIQKSRTENQRTNT